jgi:acyl-CoA thioesterase
MLRLQSLYAQHEAEFEAEHAMHLAQVRDPTALTPTQQLLKEREERAKEADELKREVAALKASLRAAEARRR